VELEASARRELRVELRARLGAVELVMRPEDANVRVDGRDVGRGARTLELAAVAHEIEVSKPGYQPRTVRVTPRPGFTKRVEVELLTLAAHREATRPVSITTAQGQRLRLVKPGRFTLGASRQEKGRRSNETLRDVELTRLFYLGTTEITNREFRAFRPDHHSERAAGESLDGAAQPVTGVSWEDAARFCNWLSVQDGLPPAYLERGGHVVATDPMTNGYRLPSEAEWAWAARFAGGHRSEPERFPWGSAPTPPPGSGNYADRAAEGLLPNVLAGYDDGYAGSAPVGRGSGNALGILDLGGNVAEWMHDVYVIHPRGLETPLRDPLGPPEGRHHVIRGASFRHASLSELRWTYRDYAESPRDDVGFRIARYAD
jgi:formylglycine-generating enzyme required for sulfatase activity